MIRTAGVCFVLLAVMLLAGCSKKADEQKAADSPAQEVSQKADEQKADERKTSDGQQKDGDDQVDGTQKKENVKGERDLSEAKSLYETARVLIDSQDGPPPAEAIDKLGKSANMGYPPAMRDLGVFLISSSEESKVKEQGLNFIVRAFEAGETGAVQEIISYYDFSLSDEADSAKMLSSEKKLVEYASRGRGLLLPCRMLLRYSHHEDVEIRSTALKNLASCIGTLKPEMLQCDLMRSIVERDEEFVKLEPEFRRAVGEALVACYERVEDEDREAVATKVGELRADLRYVW